MTTLFGPVRRVKHHTGSRHGWLRFLLDEATVQHSFDWTLDFAHGSDEQDRDALSTEVAMAVSSTGYRRCWDMDRCALEELLFVSTND